MSTILTNRRSFLIGLVAGITAPAIILPREERQEVTEKPYHFISNALA